MTAYGLLVSPSHNRVYAQAAAGMVKAELAVFGERALGGRVHDIEETAIGGVPYVTFSADELTDQDVRLLSNLSSLYALFRIEGELLRPVMLQPLDLFGSDLLTIQKYSGKTNEYFTKLLLNITAMATDSPMDLVTGRPRVLDPMCGRGTTLNQAMMYGLDAAGIDIDAKDFDAYAAFVKTWLKNNRVKHQAEITGIRREKAVLGRRLHVTLGASKERYKSGETMEITVVNADSLGAGRFFRPASFDLIVTDAPYGVQHGSRPKGAQPGRKGKPHLSRSPVELLTAAVPEWTRLLRPGGAIGISWNTLVGRREQLAEILASSGLDVRDSGAYRGFRHRVDQAITRDLIVAAKPASG
ncbi:TRM11 family SAM-dependent methyltransferase [Actinomadura madurae]|uniref:TRM11 family SAM-dependent methyltransferase n=2 Tax=Actinomadura madurae TaxID=1993 RepID=UPI0020D22770|nr:SAM-dependent methyltransferase [Actinomadura madurae]MCP9983740.1 SAM-dependent methyltransferase [Actinomadura madurae]MCQ0004697.1 SAM-dependent methyltransferase [Actinomadura madurae]